MPPAPRSRSLRLGLLGGTFDPPHLGHLLIAWKALCCIPLDRVIFIPCRQSPHKQAATAATSRQRHAMLKACLRGQSWAAVSDHEIARKTPSYSIDTVDYFGQRHPGAALFWILGSDQWQTLPRWHRAKELRTKVEFIVFPRPDRPRPMKHWKKHDLDVRIDLSATEIRALCSEGHCPPWLLPSPVFRFINRHRLYQTA